MYWLDVDANEKGREANKVAFPVVKGAMAVACEINRKH